MFIVLIPQSAVDVHGDVLLGTGATAKVYKGAFSGCESIK